MGTMSELKERLLPPRPSSAITLRGGDGGSRPSPSERQPLLGVDVLGLKKRGQGLKSWICVDTFANTQVIAVCVCYITSWSVCYIAHIIMMSLYQSDVGSSNSIYGSKSLFMYLWVAHSKTREYNLS